MDLLPNLTGFDWDKGNRNKNWLKHRVSDAECEEVFFNVPLAVHPDRVHSSAEDRYYVLGRTNAGRLLFLVFTPRGEKMRVISARDMTREERRMYHESEETYS